MTTTLGTISATIHLDAGTATFAHENLGYPEAYRMEIRPLTREDDAEAFDDGLRFVLTDSSDADAVLFATIKDAVSYAWRTLLEDALEAEED